MAILESSMEEHKKVHKQSQKSKKNTFLLAQDLNYARNLAANEEKLRRRSLKYLKKYLEQRSKASPLTEESLQVLWKGLFYSMWMSDKPLVQEECAENIAHLIHCLDFSQAMMFFKFGIVTLQNEWIGIDQLRLDKFLMFVRRLLRQALFVLKKTNFKKQPNEEFAKILQETILTTTEIVPLGLVMHFTEIYLEELAKVSDGKLQPSRSLDFLKPFITKLAFANDNRIIQWIVKFIFTHLMKQHKLGLEYEEKYKVWKAQGFVGSINQIQKVIVSDEEAEDSDISMEMIEDENKPLDPRAGKVNVELPQIHFSAKEISEALLVPKNDPRTTKNTRNHLSIWSEKFLKLHNGIYPLGIKKLESKKRKKCDIDTNIDRAAKRLIKFEQKLLAKRNKRKRENSESQDEEIDTPKIKKKKKKIHNDKASTTIAENSEESQNIKTAFREEQVEEDINVATKSAKKKSKKIKALEQKKEEKQEALKKKIKKKKSKRISFSNELDDSFDDYNYCFERNSGVWVVTPEFRETPSKSIANRPNITQVNSKKDNEDDLKEGEYEVFVPSKKFLTKLKKTKGDDEVEQVLNKLRGKSLAANNAMKKKAQINMGTPKKVVINTKLNVSQEIDDHIIQVLSSPQIPWDSQKKPGKPLLKTPVRPSPINPFYKLRKNSFL